MESVQLHAPSLGESKLCKMEMYFYVPEIYSVRQEKVKKTKSYHDDGSADLH